MQLANATGGDSRRLANGTALNVPRVLPVRTASTFKGDDWIGLKMRDVSVVRGIGVLPIFAGLIGLLLLVGDEPFYAKAGFRRIPKGQVKMPGPVDPARLLVNELVSGAFDGVGGLIRPDWIDKADQQQQGAS